MTSIENQKTIFAIAFELFLHLKGRSHPVFLDIFRSVWVFIAEVQRGKNRAINNCTISVQTDVNMNSCKVLD
jgi:hypothetical protein